MAKIKQGILGGFSGKVANVVGTSWKGRAVMKSQPLSVANPRTEAQTEQRGKFSSIAKLASEILTTFVQPVENPVAGNISGYNKFVKDNKGAFDALGVLSADNFKCGGGTLPSITFTTATVDASDTTLALGWTNPGTISPLRLTDKFYYALFSADGRLMLVRSGATTRGNTSVSVNFSGSGVTVEEDDKCYLLFAFVAADGRDVSVLTNALEITVQA